ncbi:MAG: HAMP domain-containing sensor histidine kinase [Vicinamibacterales bacterium]
MVAVLVVLEIAVGAVHERLGLARIDADLAAAMRSMAGVVASEIDERFDLTMGAHEAMTELELPGVGVAVLDASGRMLATRTSGVVALPPARMAAAPAGAPARTLIPERVRLAASSWRHGPDVYRVVGWIALDAFDREHATVMNTIRLASPFAVLAALAGGWLFVWRALRPLSVMSARADAIDRRFLHARLPVPEPADDIRRLAVAFNGLLDRLARSMGAQRQFMTDASHELRTPVSVVRTTAQVTLSAPHRGESEYREALDIVAAQAARLTHVVDDLFLLAVADVDGRPLASRFLYFDELVADCVKSLAVLADGRRIRISLTAPEGVEMRGDEELLRRMVTNLLDNAIRYAPGDSVVEVTVTVSNEAIELCVRDEGPGIPEGDRERVFERFVRLEASRATAGGGLGLAIARWVAEQHEGTMRLAAAARGSCFVATLPTHPGARDRHP